MELASGIVSTVFGLYKNINPSTLSGVNDIIVVEDSDGTLRCSPFEVRFGKVQMFRITSRIVHIYVNGNMTEIVMTIGKQGELYFEVDTNRMEKNNVIFDINYLQEITDEEEDCFSDSEICMKEYQIKRTEVRRRDSNDPEVPVKKPKLYTKKYVESKRSLNLKKRVFNKEFLVKCHNPYLKLVSRYRTFDRLVNSFEYFEFLLSNSRTILHILKGIWNHPANPDAECEERIEEPCRAACLNFSLCGSQRTEGGIELAFNGCEVQRIRDAEKLFVKVSGCKKC